MVEVATFDVDRTSLLEESAYKEEVDRVDLAFVDVEELVVLIVVAREVDDVVAFVVVVREVVRNDVLLVVDNFEEEELEGLRGIEDVPDIDDVVEVVFSKFQQGYPAASRFSFFNKAWNPNLFKAVQRVGFLMPP